MMACRQPTPSGACRSPATDSWNQVPIAPSMKWFADLRLRIPVQCSTSAVAPSASICP